MKPIPFATCGVDIPDTLDAAESTTRGKHPSTNMLLKIPKSMPGKAKRLKKCDYKFEDLAAALEPSGPVSPVSVWKSLVDREHESVLFYQIDTSGDIPKLSKCLRVRCEQDDRKEFRLVPAVFIDEQLIAEAPEKASLGTSCDISCAGDVTSLLEFIDLYPDVHDLSEEIRTYPLVNGMDCNVSQPEPVLPLEHTGTDNMEETMSLLPEGVQKNEDNETVSSSKGKTDDGNITVSQASGPGHVSTVRPSTGTAAFSSKIDLGKVQSQLIQKLFDSEVGTSTKEKICELLNIPYVRQEWVPRRAWSDEEEGRRRCKLCGHKADKKTKRVCQICDMPCCHYHTENVCVKCFDQIK